MNQPYPPHGQPHYQQQPGHPGYPQQGYPPAPPPKKRKVWPWVLLAVVLVPILGFVACTAMVGGAINAVDEARKGGTVALGETFTYQSGVQVAAFPPTTYKSNNQFIVGAGETGYKTTVAVVNGSDKPVGAALVTINATVGSTPAERVFEDANLPTQDVAPGQRLDIPFQFKVKKGTAGDLQIAVTVDFNEPVFFTGKLG